MFRNECDLGALFAEEIEQQRAANPAATIDFEVEGSVSGRWDGRRLKQVLRNLITNAVAYGEPGKPIETRLCGDSSAVVFSVANYGTAIPDAVKEQLFKPLIRGPHGTRDSDGHLGIGLYIVREIVGAHGGQTEVKCEDGKTEFIVRLPVTTEATPQASGDAVADCASDSAGNVARDGSNS